MSAHKDLGEAERQRRGEPPPSPDLPLPLTVPLEALRIANATVDTLHSSATRISLSFATHLSGEDTNGPAVISSSDAVLIARDLLAAVSAMATAFAVIPVGDTSPALRQALSDPALEEKVRRAFIRALEATLPAKGHEMIVNAWSAMLEVFLRGADAPPSA